MRTSRSFVPTLKEVPADAQVASHQLLVRAGFIRQLAAGIYSMLPLGQKSLLKITRIIREEMEAIGGQEFYLPALNPREVWEESGRWTVMGENMFRLKDRKGADLCLAMTHEEIFTVIARAELRSYRQLPQTWYQIQTKFRDEPRPKSGLLRVRQFTMKDSYSFDASREGLDKSFEDHRQAYVEIFGRCGLRTIQVDAHSGAMGGSGSTEFMVPTDAGEDLIASCESCGYGAKTEKAGSTVETRDRYAAAGASPPLEEFATPGVATIEDLARKPYGVAADQQLKTLVYAADEQPVVAIVRGDDQLNEAKLQTATGAQVLRPAHPEEIQKWMGARPGSLGGVGISKARVYLDRRLAGLSGLVTGANKDGFHVRNLSVARDLSHATSADLRTVNAGEGCPTCGKPLAVGKALEVGHIFKLGTRYSESMGARVLDEAGKEVPIGMGSYGIGAALDVPDPAAAAALARKLAGHVGMFKVGLELFVAHGPAALEAVRPFGLPIFLDLKLHDIPQTVEAAARGAGALGAALVTAHASGGSEMIAAARRGLSAGAAAAGVAAPKLLAVTVLTSLAAEDLRALGLAGTPGQAALRLARVAVEAGEGAAEAEDVGAVGLAGVLHQAERALDHPVLVQPPLAGPEADVQVGLRKRQERPQPDAAVRLGVQIAPARLGLVDAREALV